MTYAVTHFLIPAFLVALFRDFCLSGNKKRNFPLHYVLIAGLGGILMDTDYVLYYLFNFLGVTISSHRIFFHNLFFVGILVLLSIIFMKIKLRELGKHKLKLSTIFFILAFASLTHLVLDYLVWGSVSLFYPFLSQEFGLNLVSKLPLILQQSIVEVIDAVLLVLWMIYLEVKHKISDFI